MAIWYWDPVGGNDANDGTTFANRKLTLQSLSTVAAGDSVRCIASPDPVNTGVNGTWTDGSNTITLSAAVNQLIASCDTNWTASANVTCTAQTAGRKEGTACQQTAIAAGFTTGKAAYFATGTLNLSTYQQITFWITQTAGTLAVAGDYTISLCSDTLGATQVNNFAIPAIPALNQPTPITINLATNLGASIQSIAFYVNVDRGAVTFRMDDFNAVAASGSASALSLTSLISKNNGTTITTEPWFGIRSINGTTVILDSAPQYTLDLAATDTTYSGTTETVALYRRETLKTVATSVATNYVNYYAGATGTSVAGVTISGGWNTTDMSTQTGQTYLDGQNGLGYGLALSNASGNISYVTLSNINASRYQAGLFNQLGSSTTNITVIADNFNNNTLYGINISSNCKNSTYTITNIVKTGYTNAGSNGFNIQASNNRNTITITNLNSNYSYGLYITGSGSAVPYANTITITNVSRNILSGLSIYGLVSSTLTVSNAAYNVASANAGYAQIEIQPSSPSFNSGVNNTVSVGSHDNLINVGNITSTAATSTGILFGSGCDNNKVSMTGVFTGFTSQTYACINGASGGSNYLTSSGSVFTAGQTWATAGGCAKIYISTADTIQPSAATSTGSNAQILIKNMYGILGQNYILYGNSWGLI